MRRIVFAVLVWGVSFLLATGSLAQTERVLGDVNGDGVVNSLDLVLVSSAFGKPLENADVNGDGIVNILDLVLVAKQIENTETGGTLIFGRSHDSMSLDPAEAIDAESHRVCEMIYDALVKSGENSGEFQPALAASWDVSADRLIWTFHLRQEVRFHDGTRFDADAVVFSFNRRPPIVVNLFDEIIERITPLNAFTVQIALKRPYAPFLSLLSSALIVSPSAVLHFGEHFSRNPVGTGPFKFLQWDENDKIILTASEEHFGGSPALDGIIFRVIAEDSARLAALQNGNIHIMTSPNIDEIPRIETDPALQLLSRAGLNIGYLAMNMEKSPFENLKVRRALNHAINKTQILENIYQGLGIPAKTPIPTTLWSYDASIVPYAYDPEHAKQLLSEAGYPQGFQTTLSVIDRLVAIKLARAIVEDLQIVGIDAKLLMFPDWATYLEKLGKGEHDMAMDAITFLGDPDFFFYALLSKNSPENIAFYRSDAMQAILERARASYDQNERIDLYQQAQALFHRDTPWVPLVHVTRLLVTHKSVKNVNFGSDFSSHYLRDAYISQD